MPWAQGVGRRIAPTRPHLLCFQFYFHETAYLSKVHGAGGYQVPSVCKWQLVPTILTTVGGRHPLNTTGMTIWPVDPTPQMS